MNRPKLEEFKREIHDGQDYADWYEEYCKALEEYADYLEKRIVQVDSHCYSYKMEKITDIDLADARFWGFALASKNPYSIIELVESMGLEKHEWEDLKKRDRLYLKYLDVEEIDKYFEI